MDLPIHLSEFIKSLNLNSVEYVVVGGYEQAYNAGPRSKSENKRADGRPQGLADLEALS
jgi:hypothetical protein